MDKKPDDQGGRASMIPAFVRDILDHGIPGKARLRYVFGSGLFFALVLQVATGIAMAFYYVPSARDAYGSVFYIQNEVTMGWLVRGIHHYGASLMIVLAVLHLAQVFIAGAYRAPRQANWLTGVGLLGLLFAFGLTGYLLPWDQTGYWATRVATSIAGGVPVVGELSQKALVGGNSYGTATLTRFYALHVFALPLGLMALLAPHLMLFVTLGVTAPPKDVESGKSQAFWPFQAFYDLVFVVVILLIVMTLAIVVGAPLGAPADPVGTFDARPEWYFLFLFQLLKYFEGPLVLIGTVVIPGGVVTFLVLLPWLDRAKSLGFMARWKVAAPMVLILVGIVGLTVQARMSDSANAEYQKHVILQDKETRFAHEHARAGFSPEGKIMALEGRRLFSALGCSGCHKAEGEGEIKGPTLDNFTSRAWFQGQLHDPDAPERFGNTPFKGEMEAVELEPGPMGDLVEFLASRTGLAYVPSLDAAKVERGEGVFEEEGCDACHAMEGESLGAPNLGDYGSDTFLRALFKDPAADTLYGSLNEMPSFKDLSVNQVESLISYLRALRADRPVAGSAL